MLNVIRGLQVLKRQNYIRQNNLFCSFAKILSLQFYPLYGILQGIPHVVCYLDDILITGESEAQHLQHLEEVLRRLQENGVRLHRNKCHFFQPSVEYLGHHIDAEGVHTSDTKVKAIVKAPVPRNVSELRSFFGLVNYYGKLFISCSLFVLNLVF